MKRIKYAKEPVLELHRWIVNVGAKRGKSWTSKFYYLSTKKQVREIFSKAPKGSVIEIHKATHNFVEAWQK